MRTTVDLDDDLLHKAMKAAQTKTKRATLERGLRLVIRYGHVERLRSKRGTGAITWTLRELARWRSAERGTRSR